MFCGIKVSYKFEPTNRGNNISAYLTLAEEQGITNIAQLMFGTGYDNNGLVTVGGSYFYPVICARLSGSTDDFVSTDIYLIKGEVNSVNVNPVTSLISCQNSNNMLTLKKNIKISSNLPSGTLTTTLSFIY